MDQKELQRIKQQFSIIGNSAQLNRGIEIAVQVALTDLSVLITGESGVGKEHFLPGNILPVCQAVLDIGGKALGVAAPVLLSDDHLVIHDFNTGLQVQKICAQSISVIW